jgi:hypothetical protein
MSKTIEVHRHFNLVEMQQDDPSVKAWLGEAFKPIGPYFEPGGKAVGTGLSFKEQNILMPEQLGIESTDKDFRRAVTDFFHNILTNVPKDGLKLEVGLEDDKAELSKDNMPINVREYIIFRHLLKHPQVAPDRPTAEREIMRRFYLVDPHKVAASVNAINKTEDEALGLYFKHKDNPIKVDQILTMMGINARDMKRDQKVVKLKQLASKDPKLNSTEQAELFKNFIETCNDVNLETKYLVEELIAIKYLKRIGTSVLIDESNESLGDNMDEVIHFLNNPKNSKTLNVLKAQYQFKVKKGKDFEVPKAQEVKETEKTE